MLRRNERAAQSRVRTSQKEVTRADGHLKPHYRGDHMGTDTQVAQCGALGGSTGEQGSLESLQFQQNNVC